MLSGTIDEIQRDPLKYLCQVEAGETLVIIRSDKPIAELRPISSSKQLRSSYNIEAQYYAGVTVTDAGGGCPKLLTAG